MPINPAPIQDPVATENGRAGQRWVRWFDSIVRILGIIRTDGTIAPVELADADAPNNSIYNSSTQSKLVYKDGAGNVNDLY